MASEKKVLLVFTKMDNDSLVNSTDESLKKVIQKAAIAPIKVKGDLKTEVGSGAEAGELIWDAAAKNNINVDTLENGGEFIITDVNSADEIDKVLAKAMELAGNKLLAIIVSPTQAIFYGYGIERGKKLNNAIPAASIAPTIAFLADLPFPEQVEAPIAYQVIKGLNFKMKQNRKMETANKAMMEAMERENRKPWEKHDCA